MGLTFIILFAMELTIAKTRQDALFFAVCIVGLGLGARSWAQRLAGYRTLVVKEHIAAQIAPDAVPDVKISIDTQKSILCCSRNHASLKFALEEARLRNATLYCFICKRNFNPYTWHTKHTNFNPMAR
jgi:hypothetical protein